ncbi:MAG: response regulator, partial [Nocardioidaceae bacterium]
MRLVVGEDSVLFREGLVRLLADAGHEVAAAVGDADAMESAVRDLRPDLVIADIRMPPAMESDGARAAARIRKHRPDVGILLLSQHVELRECL